MILCRLAMALAVQVFYAHTAMFAVCRAADSFPRSSIRVHGAPTTLSSTSKALISAQIAQGCEAQRIIGLELGNEHEQITAVSLGR
jgi:hypothetical protein